MFEALVLTAALAAGPTEVPETVPNRWQDSNSAVWRGVPRWIRDFGFCVRRHESLHAGHYKAENPSSTASGAHQFLDGTWKGNAKWTKFKGRFVARQYHSASDAPPWVQDAVFIHSVRHGGVGNWKGTHCGYGT